MSTPPRRPIVIPIRVASAPAPAAGHPQGHGHAHEHGHGHAHGDCCTPDLHSAPPPVHADAPAGTQAARFRIEQMDCPTEERLIRQKLEPMAGVARLDFNLLAREASVASMRNKVDLPQPECPMRVTNSPLLTVRSMLRSAGKSPLAVLKVWATP